MSICQSSKANAHMFKKETEEKRVMQIEKMVVYVNRSNT
jgi:hypothetical protein